MARSTDLRRPILAVAVAALALPAAACNGGPSKSKALELVQASVHEDDTCTLPREILGALKMQYATKGICVPIKGADKASACVDALVAAGVTRPEPASYMVAWPDDVASATLSELPASARHARNLDFKTCVEMKEHLREGRFSCADVKADKVLKVKKAGEGRFLVTYERVVTPKASLTAIEAACGAVTRPPVEATAIATKGEGGAGWVISQPGANDGAEP